MFWLEGILLASSSQSEQVTQKIVMTLG
jgi:hypothetical protein